ncbi:MAG: DUF1761 domain-containing protein [Actinomycetota bacterium]
MSLDVLSELNWLAVLVATVAFFVLGGIWYSNAVFGKAWARADGYQRPEGQSPGAVWFIVPYISNFIGVLVTAMLAVATGSTTVGDGLVLGAVVGVGFSGVILVISLTRPNPTMYTLINSLYQIVGLLGVGVILSVWD